MGNMLDRATPVRNMLGELALEHQLDYEKESAAYTGLNDEAQANLTAANFRAVKARSRRSSPRGRPGCRS